MAQNNYLAKVEFNRKANEATSIHVLTDVAKAFGSFWWFFGALSVWATYVTLNLILSDWGIDPIILMAVVFGISLIWDIFKYFAIEWVYADQVLSTRMTAKVVLVLLVGGSMLFHWYGAEVRKSSKATTIVKDEVKIQRKLEQQKIELQKELLDSNKALVPVLLNKTSKDDADTVKTMNTTLELIKNIQGENKVIDTDKLLSIYANDIDVKSDGIMYAQIIAETFLLFSLLSKFIYAANRDEEMQDLSEMYASLQEMLHLSRSNLTKEFVTDTLAQIQQQHIYEQNGGEQKGREYFKQKIFEAKKYLKFEQKAPTQEVQEEPKQLPTVKPSFAKRKREEEYVEEINECPEDIIDIETVEIDGKKYRCLDYRNYNDDEIYLIKVLWDNGDILPGEFLTKTEPILSNEVHRKKVDKIVHVLTVLRGKLAEKEYIKNSSRGYIANSALPKQLWQDKEE